MIGYQEGGLTSLLSLFSGANKGQEQIEDIEQSEAPMVDMEAVLARKKAQDDASFSFVPQLGPFEGTRIYAGTPEMEEHNVYRDTSPQYKIYKDALRPGVGAKGRREALEKARAFVEPQEKKRGILGLLGFQEGGMQNNYRGGGLISMSPYARRII